MCFKTKVSTPSYDAKKALDPAPLAEEVKGVQFGGQDEGNTTDSDNDVTGHDAVTVKKTTSSETPTASKTTDTTDSTSTVDVTKAAKSKTASSIRKALQR